MTTTTALETLAQGDSSSNLSAPLYITIGPPNSGKTTWLRRQRSGSDLVDVALDDQPNVYMAIPLELFVASQSSLQNGTDLTPEHQQLLQQSFFQKTVQERLLAPEQQELRWVLQRLSGKITAAELEESIRSILISKEENETSAGRNMSNTDDNASEKVLQSLLQSTENLLRDDTAISKVPILVDLFMVEALFQKDPSRNIAQTGIERATNLLRQTPKDVPVAWGNTNTKPRDYSTALEIAQQQGRPVNFCVFETANNLSSVTPSAAATESLFDLPSLEFQELMDRNIRRLVETGRYVPSQVIWDMCGRVTEFLDGALRQLSEHSLENEPTKFDFHRQLARLALFDLQENRTVTKREQPKREFGGRGRWQQQRGRYQNNRSNNRTQPYTHGSRFQQQNGGRGVRGWEQSRSGGRGPPTRGNHSQPHNQNGRWTSDGRGRSSGGPDRQGYGPLGGGRGRIHPSYGSHKCGSARPPQIDYCMHSL
ncbi:HSPB (Heat shock 27kDa) associated protein 1 [Seminavis robusta]|uniref:HSPB (Heat shock 27kDa) associated protein 1 n=1 Tax=Seminavis robusta TaxID=568900 RepID=A0A9N8EBJ1_9STRA|nr:HSPB (Heat shock 27kDa) associated protein 1 [Seminavis robusta]|eukprot:Sro710_g191180.1 HSPB (Heat shock 27kDa) associated protein 1 (483) ;mRNA; f:50017-51465